jgi:hypothetical protein
VAIQAAATLGGDVTLTLPTDDGTSASQWLLTDGSGNLSFSDTSTIAKIIDVATDTTPLTLTGHTTQSSSDLFIVEAAGGADSLVVNGDDEATGGNVVLRGTATNDAAAAGFVGETVTLSLLRASANALATGTAENLNGSFALTAGDWDLNACVAYLPNAATSVTRYDFAISTTTGTLPASSTLLVPNSTGEARFQFNQVAQIPVGEFMACMSPYRISISGSQTYYLVVLADFSVNSLSAYGYLQARRVR